MVFISARRRNGSHQLLQGCIQVCLSVCLSHAVSLNIHNVSTKYKVPWLIPRSRLFCIISTYSKWHVKYYSQREANCHSLENVSLYNVLKSSKQDGTQGKPEKRGVGSRHKWFSMITSSESPVSIPLSFNKISLPYVPNILNRYISLLCTRSVHT